jgi:outer membrane murein-binding lipoprotein Lpp
MNAKIGKLIAVVSMFGLLAGCAQTGALEAHNAELNQAAQNARTYADHDRLAKQYKNNARQLLVKADEQKKLLSQYQEKSYMYGRQAQDLQSHTVALLQKYERAVESNIQQAAYHQKMAAELAKGDYAAERSERENKAKAGTNSDSGRL